MRWYYKLPLRLRSLFRKNKTELDLSEELQFHLQNQIDEFVAKGMDAKEARQAAFRSLGGVEQVKEECRDARGVNFIEDFMQDVRFGVRLLLRSPGFAVLVILCLTLGIGANAAVFSWVEGILLQPYPLVSHQERLVALTGTVRDQRDQTSWPDLLDVRRSCTLCESLFVSNITGATLSIGERAQVITGSIVSANYFDAIGVHPILGRGFEPGDDIGRNAHPIVVISYHLWQTRFKGDPQIVGKSQRFDNVMHTIIGVMPEGFYGTFVGRAMEYWVPLSMVDAFYGGSGKLVDRSARWCEAYVRLKPGVTRSQAQQEISAIAARLEAEYPATNRGRGIRAWALWETPFNHAGHLLPVFEIMVVVVIFVLLIVCANVGNLLLVRSFARRREMTVRVAMGAGRSRLLRQLVTEGLLLSACGAAGGMLVAYWCRHALVLLDSIGGGDVYLPGKIDGPVLGLSAAICLIITLAVGLVPAFQTRHLALAETLKTEASSVMGTRGRVWFRSSLVVLQVTLSFILLVGATLLMQSLRKIRTTSPGFSSARVFDTSVSLTTDGYDAPRAKTFQDELIERVRALPGVEAAAYARAVPLSYGGFSSTPIAVDGFELPPNGQSPDELYNEVSPGYFTTMGIPLVSGREFTRADDENAPRVAIVNQTMVARYWRGQNPIGRRIQVKGNWARVVGVVKDSKYYSMNETPRAFFYVPLGQYFLIEPDIHIRTTQPLQTIQAALIREVHALDPNLALYEMTTLQEIANRTTSEQFAAVALVALFGGLALLLAGIGLYGVMSYTVSQSTRELGLRMALGAGTSSVLRLVLTRGLLLTTTGITIGFGLALLLTRLLGDLLYQVSPRDPLAFAAAFAVMALASLAACFLPAWRATRTDPMRALRAE